MSDPDNNEDIEDIDDTEGHTAKVHGLQPADRTEPPVDPFDR